MTAIMSMTAYSRQTEKKYWGEITWELRSVNHRFLDLSLRLPEELNELEMNVRALVRQHVSRGKIMASLFYVPGEQEPFQSEINPAILKQLVSAATQLKQHFDLNTDFTQLLKWPGLLNIIPLHQDELLSTAKALLEKTLIDLVATRQREGEQLQHFIDLKLEKINTEIKKIESKLPQAETAHKERLQSRLTELTTTVDHQRLHQEILFYLQKIDIAEEIQRLTTHVIEMKRVLKVGGAIGRRLDFLMQEMQREANTLGNKINDLTIQQANVELKVLIEQIREQVQNIE